MRDKTLPILYVLLSIVVISASVQRMMVPEVEEDSSMAGIRLRCAIVSPTSMEHYPGLTFGLNYEMLKDYAVAQNDTLISIVIADNTSSYLDSLRQGAVDVLVMPVCDTVMADSVLLSHPVEGTTIWAIRDEYADGLEEMNTWMDEYCSTDRYNIRRDLYLLRYSPSRRAEHSRITPELSPYDSLIKVSSKRLKWDWRLLAAIIYHESMFHIEVNSPRGAGGLMQMMPATAAKYGVKDMLNPEEAIKGGAEYLAKLERMFRDKASDEEELQKFVLAAYNAGEGRILDCINYAQYRKLDPGFWDNIVIAIPDMRDSTILQIDTVKLGMFQGYETINYVDSVLDIYEDFKMICP